MPAVPHIYPMKHIALLTTLIIATTPAQAQIATPEGLLDRLEELAKPILPMLRDLEDTIRNAPGYYPPELLPNGDIIIRKRPDTTPQPAPDDTAPITDPLEL